ncbi:MAG: acyl carrier protein [Magnetococcales bacterium]|nr:acyl carrier protein [Magnetococcales bacterium]
MNSDVENRLQEIMKIVMDLPPDTDVTTIKRINDKRWDSLAHSSLIAAVENEFCMQFDIQEIELCGSYATTLAFINEKIS